jgi:hypothetical protein
VCHSASSGPCLYRRRAPKGRRERIRRPARPSSSRRGWRGPRTAGRGTVGAPTAPPPCPRFRLGSGSPGRCRTGWARLVSCDPARTQARACVRRAVPCRVPRPRRSYRDDVSPCRCHSVLPGWPVPATRPKCRRVASLASDKSLLAPARRRHRPIATETCVLARRGEFLTPAPAVARISSPSHPVTKNFPKMPTNIYG